MRLSSHVHRIKYVLGSIKYVLGKACDPRSRFYRRLEAGVPPYDLPPLLRCADGDVVNDPGSWMAKRRPEILRLFEEHVYGRVPPPPARVTWTDRVLDESALGGLATMKEIEIRLTPDGPDVVVLLFLPNDAPRPVPAFLGLNFLGNQTVLADPAITPPRGWLPANPVLARGIDASRGARAGRWPARRVVEAGFALATAYYGDIVPDHPDLFGAGVQARFHATREEVPPDGWGAIGAWAWGLGRIMDCLVADPAIDGTRVTVIGHSRLGKAALWAGALDQRFAAVISNDSGCGGAAISRRRVGETVAKINAQFPHWFCKAFHRYDGKEDELPVDQHMLLALVAPRPLYVASAQRDLWADPRGEFLSCVHASPAYTLFGFEGLPATEMPPVNEPVSGRVAYHMRAGRHDLTGYDWARYVAFIHHQLAP